MNAFYEPTSEHLTRLAEPWSCSYSGGKDSTSLVTWIEWLRRAGWITVDSPKLIQSDTGVEEDSLAQISEDMRRALSSFGWNCRVVVPPIGKRLYVSILGRGLPPVHPGVRKMRWCTQATKVGPMQHVVGDGEIFLTGVRIGESAMRDSKIKRKGCSAGGECGIPDVSDKTYSPILHWTTCHVIDWLNGSVPREIQKSIGDLFAITKRLADIYEVRIGQPTFEFSDPEISAARFGCKGCPAIGVTVPRSVIRRYGANHPFTELYAVWNEARKRENRLVNLRSPDGRGPIRMDARKRLFAWVMDIQRRAGVVLITPEDEAFIRDCWDRKVYPRGWSEADELAEMPPEKTPLFQENP